MLTPATISLSAALLIGAVVLLRWLGKGLRLPAEIVPALWWLVLLRLLLPLPLPGHFSIWPRLAQEKAPAGIALTGQAPLPEAQTAYAHPPTDLPATSPLLPEPLASTGPEAEAWPLWLLVWAVGALLCAGCFGLAYFRCCRRFQQSLPIEGPGADFVQQWLAEHPLRRTIQVRISPDIEAPLTYGCLKPQILLPATVDFSQQQALHFALLHEWFHIRRFDAAAKLLAAAALCLHWFNPAVWLFFWLFSRDLELACDSAAVKEQSRQQAEICLATRQAYAMALLDWEQHRQNASLGLFNSFGKNVIQERIVAIMNIKKVSILSLLGCGLLLALACGMVLATSPAEAAKNNDDPEALDLLQLSATDQLDYDSLSDDELHQLYVESYQQNLARQLAPYAALGLVWSFEDQDMDGIGLEMSYQGRAVRGVWDETAGLWITEHSGLNFPPEAGELLAVYTDGQLSGLRFADEEEQAVWDKLREQSGIAQTEVYAPFGMELDNDHHLVFNGEMVRYFWDGYEIKNDEVEGRAIKFEYVNSAGKIDVRTRRQVIQNQDGSTDPMGPLLALEIYTEPNFTAMLEPVAQQVAYVTYHTNDEGSAESGLTIAQHLAPYRRFGLDYREEITAQGTQRYIYYNGQPMASFVDRRPDGGIFSVHSDNRADAVNVVQTVYDENGQLIGLQAVSAEEAINGGLIRQPARNFPAFNEEGERVLYYSTDNNQTFKAIGQSTQQDISDYTEDTAVQ